MVVVAISDATVSRSIVAAVRTLSTAAHVIVRSRYVREMGSLLDAGANDVIPEEFETSIQIFHRVLRRYLVPEDRINALVAQCRSQHYGLLRGTSGNKVRTALPEDTPDMEIVTITVTLGKGKVVGHTVDEIDLRERYGVHLLAIRRKGRFIAPVTGDLRVLTDDTLYLLGAPDLILRLDQDLR